MEADQRDGFSSKRRGCFEKLQSMAAEKDKQQRENQERKARLGPALVSRRPRQARQNRSHGFSSATAEEN